MLLFEGFLRKDKYEELFLDRYAVAGERIKVSNNAVVIGVIFYKNRDNEVKKLPMFRWVENSETYYCCQAGEFGHPPKLSSLKHSKGELFEDLKNQLTK